MDQSLDTYTLLTSLCAFVLLQPGMIMPGNDPLFEHPGANITSSHLLLEEAMRVRKGYDYTESPTLNTLCTSYFIFGCYYALEMHEKAWYHLREAATLAHMGGMTQEEKFMQFDGIESSRRRRLYWLVFVAERFVDCYWPCLLYIVLADHGFQGIRTQIQPTSVAPDDNKSPDDE